MNHRQLVGRAIALAIVLALAAGMLVAEGEALTATTSLALVLMGAMAVGGLAPRRWWWLGGLVGVGVAIGLVAATAGPWASSALEGRGRDWAGNAWLPLVVPVLVAVAASGLGASLQRFTNAGQDR